MISDVSVQPTFPTQASTHVDLRSQMERNVYSCCLAHLSFFFALADSEFPFQYIFLCYVKYLISRAKSAWARHFDILFIFVYIVSQGKSETNRFLWRYI